MLTADTLTHRTKEASAVPSGLILHEIVHPALKRWAIFGRPFGTHFVTGSKFYNDPRGIVMPVAHASAKNG